MTPESPLDALRRLDREAAPHPWEIGEASEDTIVADDYEGCVISRPLFNAHAVFWRTHPEDDLPAQLVPDPLVASTYADNAGWGDDESHPHAKANSKLIVTLRNTLPALLRLVDTVEAQMRTWDQAEAAAVVAAQNRGIATARGADSPTRSALRAALAELTTPAPAEERS